MEGKMDKALEWFIKGWCALAILVNLVAIAGMFMANGFWGGLGQLQETFSPYNIVNYVMEIVLLSPALLAFWWQERRRAASQAR
jgi:formate hydrogenlyase subunit 3/multisubunit Na+/H+ antiporter MnhD subunit